MFLRSDIHLNVYSLSLSVTQLPTNVVRDKMNSAKETEPDLKVITKNIGVTC